METSLIDKSLSNASLHILKLSPINAPIICQYVIRSDKKKKEKIVFIVTITTTAFIDKNSGSIIEMIENDNFTELNLVNKTTISIIAGKFSISIEHPNAHILFKYFLSHLINILTKGEMPKANFSQQYIGRINMARAFLKRFTYLKIKNNVNISQQETEKITEYITQKNLKTLDFFRNRHFLPYIDIILNSIEFQPSISGVIIPKTGKKGSWLNLAACLKTNTTLKHIFTYETMDSSFKQMVDALAQNPYSKLRKLTFAETNFTENDGIYLQKILSLNLITTLEFERAFTAQTFSKMLPLLAKSPGINHLTSIGFSGIVGLNAQEIFASMPWLTSISLYDSNIDISTAFAILPPNIQKIKVDGGKAINIPQSFRLPKFLNTLQLTQVKCTARSLFNMLQALINHVPTPPPNLNLENGSHPPQSPKGKKTPLNTGNADGKYDDNFEVDFSDVIMNKEQWDEFSSLKLQVMSQDPALSIFIWDNNPISQTITNALAQLPKLRVLSASGSLTEQTILPFCDFVGQCKALKRLELNGGKHNLSQDCCITLMRALKNCQNIEQLLINDQLFGEQGALELAELLYINKSIKYVEFENNDMKTREAWYGFFEKVMDRGPPLEIPWPREIMRLYKEKVFAQKDLDHLHDCWKNTENGKEENTDEGEALDFEDLDQADDGEAENEEPINIDWDVQIPSASLPSTDAIVAQTLDRLSYDKVINLLRRI